MSFRGKNKHYRWREVRVDHIRATGERCRVPATVLDEWMASLLSRVSRAIATVRRMLPKSFPADVSEPIFQGVEQTAARLALP
jgi:serine/threonine-protein kinase HipA